MEQKMMPFVLQEEKEGIPEARDDEAQDEIADKFETDSEEEDLWPTVAYLFSHFKETALLGATTNDKVSNQRKQVRA